ncbi:hypothetical protein Tco_0422097, partial [Tanacetum coccineum]
DASDNSCMDNTSSNEAESVVQQPRVLSESTPLASDGAYKANEANGGNNNMYGRKDNDAGNNKNTPGINMNGSKSDAYGRIGYARALVEINAELELKKEVIMAVPNEDGESYTREVINVEYEWKLPHCIECKTFGHSFTTCLKNVKKSDPITTTADIQEDEFTDVSNRKIKPSDSPPITKHATNKRGPEVRTSTSNSFDVLNNEDVGDECGVFSSMDIQAEEKKEGHASACKSTKWNEVLDSDEEVDEVLFPEGDKFGDSFYILLKGRVRQ